MSLIDYISIVKATLHKECLWDKIDIITELELFPWLYLEYGLQIRGGPWLIGVESLGVVQVSASAAPGAKKSSSVLST